MPFYDMMMIVRPMPKTELVECLKRAANLVWQQNGVVKKLEYLGYRKLPYSAKGEREGEKYREGSYFLYRICTNQAKIANMKPELKLDMDLISTNFNLSSESPIPADYQCTLDDELLPPFFRKSVQPLLEAENVRADVRR